MRECFFGPHAVAATYENVLGVLSLILYALIVIVSLKYIVLVMRADNQGEGGILALMSLVPRPAGSVLILLGIFGAALLYGDGMITPAVSILGAVEGLKAASPVFEPWIVPISVAILVLLFTIQQYGTHRVGGLFGPVMIVWFVVLAVLGLRWIVQAPQVLGAIDPRHAYTFFADNG